MLSRYVVLFCWWVISNSWNLLSSRTFIGNPWFRDVAVMAFRWRVHEVTLINTPDWRRCLIVSETRVSGCGWPVLPSDPVIPTTSLSTSITRYVLLTVANHVSSVKALLSSWLRIWNVLFWRHWKKLLQLISSSLGCPCQWIVPRYGGYMRWFSLLKHFLFLKHSILHHVTLYVSVSWRSH